MLANVARIAQIVLVIAAVAFVLFAYGAAPADAAGDPLAATRFSLDFDPHFTPANTATSVGSIVINSVIFENNILDGDEDFVDALQIDVVTWAGGIPAAKTRSSSTAIR